MPLQPLLSEQAAFAKHLFIQGYPLWNPDPCLLPQARQSVGLRIGDVGTVDERGRFDLFLNILDPFPPNFPPIEEDNLRYSSEDLVPRQVVSSPKTPWDVEEIDSEASATHYGATLSEDGSHVILPQGAESFELGLYHRRIFENYAREHGEDWLKCFGDRLGSPRSDSIYLVTGFYKTSSWSIASFSMRSVANTDPIGAYCILKERNEQTIQEDSVWQPTGRFDYKIGPPPDRRGENKNQTIFIRAITITPNHSKQDPSERGAGLLGSLFPLPRILNFLARRSGWDTPKSNITIQHVPQISQASHPSEIVNKFLLKKEPSAKIAVTHDSQWIKLLKLLEGGASWTLVDLENRLEASVPIQYSIATHGDTVYLRNKEHGSSTEYAISRSTLAVGPIDLPDLTEMLLQHHKHLAGVGSFGTVYRCPYVQNREVAVKAINFPRSIVQAQKDGFLRIVRRELGIWRRLDHPNIVPLLGTAQGEGFGSEYPCMVSMWMPHGTLAQYVSDRRNVLSHPARIRLITGSAAGLEYLHSKSVVHGDIHPGNILIDSDHNPRLTDFGLSQTLDHPMNGLGYPTYLWTYKNIPGAMMCAAPERLYPDLFPDAVVGLNFSIDIYSIGSIILFILSGKTPWSRGEFENKSDKLQNPPRPSSPIIPDLVWDFIERCWSPRAPRDRPSAQEVLSFSRDALQQLLQPNRDSDINVVPSVPLGMGEDFDHQSSGRGANYAKPIIYKHRSLHMTLTLSDTQWRRTVPFIGHEGISPFLRGKHKGKKLSTLRTRG